VYGLCVVCVKREYTVPRSSSYPKIDLTYHPKKQPQKHKRKGNPKDRTQGKEEIAVGKG
jgi:hypothetical protein